MSYSPNDRQADTAELLRAAPGLVRIAAGVWWRTTEWTVSTSVRAGSRVFQAALSGESPAQLLQEVGVDARDYVRRLLGVLDGEERPPAAEPEPAVSEAASPASGGDASQTRSLRERGAELLRQSADVRYREESHPAYERILGELAPDEARILRLLFLDGPQPAVDVRTWRPLDVGSQVVAPGLSMIGAQAGCRYLERVPAYLNNLHRLGLIWFSREPVRDSLRYQVLEAQPDVLEAVREAGRGRIVRRSIHLTPFGTDFCEICLPLHTAEFDVLGGGTGAAAEEPGEPADHGPGPGSDEPA
jgi:Abortive infection alpha